MWATWRIVLGLGVLALTAVSACAHDERPVLSPKRMGGEYDPVRAQADVEECWKQEVEGEPGLAEKALRGTAQRVGEASARAYAEDRSEPPAHAADPAARERKPEPDAEASDRSAPNGAKRLDEWRSQDEIRRAVEACLEARGYKVLVWR